MAPAAGTPTVGSGAAPAGGKGAADAAAEDPAASEDAPRDDLTPGAASGTAGLKAANFHEASTMGTIAGSAGLTRSGDSTGIVRVAGTPAGGASLPVIRFGARGACPCG